jgi:hypothetical protein
MESQHASNLIILIHKNFTYQNVNKKKWLYNTKQKVYNRNKRSVFGG